MTIPREIWTNFFVREIEEAIKCIEEIHNKIQQTSEWIKEKDCSVF